MEGLPVSYSLNSGDNGIGRDQLIQTQQIGQGIC